MAQPTAGSMASGPRQSAGSSLILIPAVLAPSTRSRVVSTNAEGWVTESALQTFDGRQQAAHRLHRRSRPLLAVPKPIGGGIVIVSYPWVLTPPSEDE